MDEDAEVDARVAVAERAARAGAAHAAELFRTDLTIETKAGKTDVVTRADREAQDAVVDAIAAEFPDPVIVGEENDERQTVPEKGPAWVIDPIDGTDNFVRGVPLWATAVAATVDGEPVAASVVAPALDAVYVAGEDGTTRNGEPATVSEATDPETFAAIPTFWWDYDRRDEYARACTAIVERFGDLRRWGSAVVGLAMCAEGSIDGLLSNRRMNPWDAVAGAHLVRQAGGVVTDLDGERWRHDSQGFVVSSGTRHDLFLEAAREIEG